MVELSSPLVGLSDAMNHQPATVFSSFESSKKPESDTDCVPRMRVGSFLDLW